MNAIVINENGKFKVIGNNLRPLSSYAGQEYSECYVQEYLDSRSKMELREEPIVYARKDVPPRWERYMVISHSHSRKKQGGCSDHLTVARLNKKGYIRLDEEPTAAEKLEEARKEIERIGLDLQKTERELKQAKAEIRILKIDLERLKNRSFWERVFNKQ